MPTNKDVQLKTIVDFARRKGIVYPSSEIYGGFAATYDFGPLGKLLKDNLVNAWRDWMVNYRTDTVEIEGAIFLHPKVWTASGHVGGFSDLLVEDLVTHKRYRADHLVEEAGIVWPISMNNEKLNIKTNSETVLTLGVKPAKIDNFRENVRVLLYNPKTDKYAIQFVEKWGEYNLLGGGVEQGHTQLETANKELVEESGYTDFTIISQLDGKIECFYQEDGKNFHRVSTGFLAILNSEHNVGAKMEDYEIETGSKCVWVSKQELQDIFEKQVEKDFSYSYHLEVLNRGLKFLEGNVILIDAIDCLIVDKDGDFEVNAELLEFLETRNERKILVTNAKGEVLNKVKSLLVDTGIEIFSKGFEPEKTNPEYFKLLSQELGVYLSKVFYFDHSQANLDSAKSAGVGDVLLYTGDVEFIKENTPSTLRVATPQEGNLSSEVLTDAGSLTSEEIDQIIEHYKIKSPEGNPLSKARKFNLLVKTHLGPVEDDSSLAYLKGEACQNIYVDWKAVQETTRRKIPFGIAQMGKAFRNEINVKQYLFRTREFEQIDMQYFVKPPEYIKKDEAGNKLEKDHLDWFGYWKEQRYKFYTEFLDYNPENLKWHQHTPEELVFYCVEAWDVYYNFGALGYKEMEGVHNRTDYDTRQHQQYSGTDLTYLDPETNQRYLPYIVEMSLGVNRLFLSCLFEFYKEEVISGESSKESTPSGQSPATPQEGNEETRVVFKLPYKLAPYKIAVLPLMKKDGMKEKAEEIYISLKKQGISCDYDDAGSIGKRYRRQDENGTPWCMCVDYETIKEGELQDTVTLRNRDTMEQIRVKLSEIDSRFLQEKL